ncbi:hypothetical protein GOBAR_AA29575 [Gossypium barbadense]|uniref:Uncharacterized protein n=1 Tax=Gossypium barbadense TaxID=3634 RepID=A0A2P5WJ39_GOSBA|nr:hypothetical protein GOBAR_AA29575 [Gossypium barbadense]
MAPPPAPQPQSATLASFARTDFVETPSIDLQEVADNLFGGCCCSFRGISEKLVTRFANSYRCAKGVCLLNFTTVLLCKHVLVAYFAMDSGLSEDMSSSQQRANDLCENTTALFTKEKASDFSETETSVRGYCVYTADQNILLLFTSQCTIDS